MCTLAIYFKVFPAYPVVVAANRDEFLARPATAPVVLCGRPVVVGGKDLKAGGTWLGLNEHGLIAGLLNRRSEQGTDPGLHSRGLLTLEALQHRSAAQAARYVGSCRGADYNHFNLLLASREQAFVAYNRNGVIELSELGPGLHLLTNLDVDDFECPKISRAYHRFAAVAKDRAAAADPERMCQVLGGLLADHSTQLDSRSGRPNALCLHLEGYGTRSSSVLMLDAGGRTALHFFAPGPPCTARYQRAAVPSSALEVGDGGGDEEASKRYRAQGQED